MSLGRRPDGLQPPYAREAARPRNGANADGCFSVQAGDGRGQARASVNAERRRAQLARGDMIYLGRRTLRVVGRRDDDADQPPVLVVEDVAESTTSDAA